jgi:hypothetical protein
MDGSLGYGWGLKIGMGGGSEFDGWGKKLSEWVGSEI